jgi:hypothetical protein
VIETLEQVEEFCVDAEYTPLEGDWSPKRALHELAVVDEEWTMYATPIMFAEIVKRTCSILNSGVLYIATPRGQITMKTFVE